VGAVKAMTPKDFKLPNPKAPVKARIGIEMGPWLQKL